MRERGRQRHRETHRNKERNRETETGDRERETDCRLIDWLFG